MGQCCVGGLELCRVCKGYELCRAPYCRTIGPSPEITRTERTLRTLRDTKDKLRVL